MLLGQFVLRDIHQPLSLNGEWRYHPGDDAAWASPSYDDTRWAKLVLPGPGHEVSERFYWYRFRIENPLGNRIAGLWISLPALAPSYEVFANGVRIGTFGPPPGEKYGLLRPRVAAFALPEWNSDLRLAIRASWPVPPTALVLAPVWNRTTAWAGTRTVVEGQMARAEREALERHQPFALLTAAALTAGLFLLTVPVGRRDASEYLFVGGYLVAGAFIRWVQAWTPPPLPTVGSSLLANSALILPLLVCWLGFVTRTFAPAYTRRFLRIGLTAVFAFYLAGLLLWTWAPAWLGWWQRFLTLSYASAIALALFWAQRRSSGNLGLKLAAALFVASALGAALAGFVPLLAPLAAPELRGVTVLVLGLSMAFLLNQRSRRQEEERRRLQRELEAAAEIQSLLLPTASLRNEFADIQAASLPAAEVGGDFYQALHFADGSCVAILGDVSGKGLRAAMLVSVAIGAVRRDGSSSPAAILADINQALLGRMAGGFATCCCVRCEGDGSVTIANAGHPAPMLGGQEVELEPGLPLGILPEPAYAEKVVSLEPGQQMVLVSDGVVEAENVQRELFGFDRTREISTRPAAEIAEAARAWGQNDDITVVTVRRAVA
jgi:hypothetical protein